MVALVQAHVHGVNWELWISLVVPTITVISAIGRWLNKKLAAVLTSLDIQDKSKLEFEKKVDEQHRNLGERVSRLEGPVQRTERAVAG